ncbi:uncharacterized protein LOC127246241 [Andrographis paniculata]|uniref:uncharacterized protein LOC127246241 n=1 Tax=Andrographis paniculata TaxID=175694 RepID=UPI0021E6FC11|nr:uncharacterized protein LOC127246241 [Andrographis paniculata]
MMTTTRSEASSLPPAPHHHHLHRNRLVAVKFTRYGGYLIILVCFYSLGRLSSSSSSSSPSYSSSREAAPTTPISLAEPLPPPPRIHRAEAGDDDHNLFLTRCGSPVASNHVRQTILDRVFNGSSPWQDFPPAHVAPLLRPRRIRGWGSNGAVFENLIREVRPRVIIEVGTFLGASALHMVSVARNLGLRDTQIVCVDDFRGWPGFQEKFKELKMVNGDVLLMQQFMQNVAGLKATEQVVMMPFSTSSALVKLCEWGVFGDLVEVDAGHDFHAAWSDINAAYKILKRPGGVIFGHDYFTSADSGGVRRAVHLFARLNHLRVEVDGQHWVIRPPTPTSS